MIRRAAAAGAFLLLLLSALPAQAFPGGKVGFGGWGQAQQRPQQPQRERQYQPPPRRQEGERGGQRMTPDERRQLRRDLHDANRDLRPQRRDWRQ